MTDLSFEIEKLKIDAELKKEEYRHGVKKVIYGTMIVGVAAALFPFAQKVSEAVFAERIERIKRESEFKIFKDKQELVRIQANREFLQSLAGEARSENLSKRIILAEFYSFLADEGEKKNWEEFRDHLYQVQKDLNDERETLFASATDPGASAAALLAAQTRIDQINRLETPAALPVQAFETRMNLRQTIDGLDPNQAKALIIKIETEFPRATVFVALYYPDDVRNTDADGRKAKEVLKRLVTVTVQIPKDVEKWRTAINDL